MAEGGGRGMFRKKSLERLSSPERLDQILHLADPKSWLPLVVLGALVLIVLGWSVFGRIPVYVEGRGILVKPRKVVAVQSPGSGRLVRVNVGVGQRVRSGEVLGVIARPDLAKQLELLRDEERELLGRSRSAGVLRHQKTDLEQSSTRLLGEKLKQHIERSKQLARRIHDDRLDSIDEELERVREQERVARDLTESLRERLEGQRRLHEEGVVSKAAVDDLDSDYVQSLTRLSDIEVRQRQLETTRLEVEEDYFDRLQRIADLTFDLQTLGVRGKELAQENLESEGMYERQLADVRQEIARLEETLGEETRIRSDYEGRVLEMSAVVGDVLEPGDRLGAIEVIDPDETLVSLTYFRVRDGKRVRAGLPIGVTPDTIDRERYGSIVGEVTEVSPFPVALEEVKSVVGNLAVAESLVRDGYLIQVYSRIEKMPSQPGKFRWSSSRGPGLDVTAGTTTTARVAVERHRPIALVFPLLKSAAGVD